MVKRAYNRRKKGSWRLDPICVDCDKPLKNHYALRCLVCANKGKHNPQFGKVGPIHPNFIDGGKSNCIDCNKIIHKSYKRCRSCAAMYFLNEPRFKEKLRKRMSGKGNPMYGKKHSLETIQKIIRKTRSSVKSPNILEKDFISFLAENRLNKYKFVGDGKFIIERFNPDFVCKEENKIIELYGDYWHKNDIKHKLRIKTYTDRNYDVLVIYESEFRKNKEQVLLDLKNFDSLEVYYALVR